MEIALFTDSFAPTHDGVARVTADLADSLARRGHSVRVYAPGLGRRSAPAELRSSGVRVRRFRAVPVPLYGQYRWPVFPYLSLRGEGLTGVDVVHLHSPGGIGSLGFLAARHFRTPLVGTFHTDIWAMRESLPQKWLVPLFFRCAWWFNLGLYWRCDRVTAPSRAAAQVLDAHARKPFRPPIQILPNGIDTHRFAPGRRAPEWRTREGWGDRPIVTYLARWTRDKGIHRFLDAVAAARPKTEFLAVVAGRGPEDSAVRDRIARDRHLRERTRLVGPVPEEEKASLLAASTIFVLPSVSDTGGIALLEAMASGVCAVALRQGGPAETITDGVTGRLADPADPPALARILSELLDRPEERERMARAGLDWVRRTASLEVMTDRYLAIYRAANSGSRCALPEEDGPVGSFRPGPQLPEPLNPRLLA